MTNSTATKQIPAFLCIIGVIILVALGTWQLYRLQWKQSKITQIQAQIEKEPLTEDGLLTADLEQELYRRVILTGRYDHTQEKHLFTGPRILKGEIGYDILTPLILQTGQQVLVNRGWVPATIKKAEKRPETLPQGDVSVTAMLHRKEKPGFFTPENSVDDNLWMWIDVATMLPNAVSERAKTFYLRAIKADSNATYPLPGKAKVSLRNDHLHYAITWYLLAIVLIVIYSLHNRKAGSSERNKNATST